MTDDLISRSTIKHAIYDVCLRENNIDIFEKLLDRINDLPSVNPQEPKTGHWIEKDDYLYVCSECGQYIYSETEHDLLEIHAFCGRCGCRMVEPQESEEISDTNLKMWEEIFKAESEET